VGEHSTESGHQIKFRDTEVLARISGVMEELVKLAMEIKLHADNINREEGFKLCKTWNPNTRFLGQSCARR
jgi:hypothetical protein